MIDIRWRDAMAERTISRVFSAGQRAAGWPHAMEPIQLAAMQRPYKYGESRARAQALALRDALQDACASGALLHRAETRKIRVQAEADFSPISLTRPWPDEYMRDGVARAYTRPAKYEDGVFYLVEPGAFSAWLAGQGMEPGKHIAAWFQACGVAAATAGANGLAPAQVFGADGVTDFESLARYRLQFVSCPASRRPPWLDSHIELVRAKLKEETDAGRGYGAMTRIGKALGFTGSSGLGDLLKRHPAPATLDSVWSSAARRA